MDKENNLFFNNEFALKYDDLVGKQNWYGAEILLGMIFDYLKMKNKIFRHRYRNMVECSRFSHFGFRGVWS